MTDSSISIYSETAQGPRSRSRFLAYSAMLIATVFAIVVSVGVQPAVGATVAPDSESEVTTENLANGDVSVTVGNEKYTVTLNETEGTATVVQADGTRTTVATGTVPSQAAQTDLQLATTGSAGGVTTASAEGVTCNVLMWTIGLIHSTGWGVAIPIVAASGPVGATVALTAYALGVNGFLYWVGTQCPS